MRYFIIAFLLFIYLIDFYTKDSFSFVLKNFSISEDFKTFKKFDYNEYKNKQVKQFIAEITLDKQKLANKVYYLNILCDLDSLVYTNAPYKLNGNEITIKLDKNIDQKLYFKYIYKKPKLGEFKFNIMREYEYKYIFPYEGILYGVAYGIIFSAFLYYLIIYFSTRRKYFLYYSLMQFFVLLSLIGFTYFSFKPYPSVFGQSLVDMFETLGFLFTFLFAKEILDTKRQSMDLNFIFNIFIILNILDIFAIFIFKVSILYKYMPFFIPFLLTSIAGIIMYKKRNNYALIYTIGWFVLAISVYLCERFLSPILAIYMIHMTAPLESLIFSFALAFMLRDLVKKQNEQEKILIHKSKLASIGEMINNIAHQWRQPLAHLGYINMNLEISSANNEFEKEYFVKKIKESNTQIKFMSKTIDDFRDFYKIEKHSQEFLISNACNLAINIINPSLKKRKITLNLDIKKDSKIKGYENEYAQVILNFLSNCVDVFEIKDIKEPKIDITIDIIDNKSITMVCDNAGGINKNNLQKVFEPYFTTKKRGTGIGLYMSKIIIQSHFFGKIDVSNNKKGACFKIII